MPFVGEEAVEFLVETDYDLSGASTTDLIIRKPVSGTIVTWSASVIDDTVLRYVSDTGDLDEAGEYAGHPYCVIGSKIRKGPWFKFKVGEVLDD